MAGHSKWANIRFKKGAQDAKRGKVFTKLIREITIAARTGGADVGANPRLRLAIQKAKAQSMPKDNIDRALKKGAGELEGVNYEEVRYEGYGPGGVAVLVDCLTDNRHRTAGEVRHAFSKHGGNLGADGSVSYLFSKAGLATYPAGSDEDKIMDAAIESGASDVVVGDDGGIEIICAPEDFEAVTEAMTARGFAPEHAEITMRAALRIPVDSATGETLLKLLEVLDDLDDVQHVYCNAEIPEEILQE
jgi:YebC/PmpR family DNA-binding regulatory protein